MFLDDEHEDIDPEREEVNTPIHLLPEHVTDGFRAAFDESSIFPHDNHPQFESYIAGDDILGMLVDEPVLSPLGPSRATTPIKGRSKDPLRKKQSLSKNRPAGKEGFVMKNTMEALSNQIIAKSRDTSKVPHSAAHKTSAAEEAYSRMPIASKGPTSLKELKLFSHTAENSPSKKRSTYQDIINGNFSQSTNDSPNHIEAKTRGFKENGNKKVQQSIPMLSSIIERTGSPEAPEEKKRPLAGPNGGRLYFRKMSVLEEEKVQRGNSKGNTATLKKGPVRILKPSEHSGVRLAQSIEKGKAQSHVASAKLIKSELQSSEVSFHDPCSQTQEFSLGRSRKNSKSSIDKKPPQPVYHFKTIQDVLLPKG